MGKQVNVHVFLTMMELHVNVPFALMIAAQPEFVLLKNNLPLMPIESILLLGMPKNTLGVYAILEDVDPIAL